MQLHHFLDEVESKTGALAPTVRTRQRIEALTQPRQRIVGDRLGLIEQPEFDLLPCPLGSKPQHASIRGEIQRILQQITQRLTQQKWFTVQLKIRRNRLFHTQLFTFDSRSLGVQQFIHQPCQWHCYTLLQPLALLNLGEVQQSLDQLLHPHAFAVDVTDETLLLSQRHFPLQQFRRAPNRRQRALQFMGQGVDVTLDVGFAFELGAHLFHRRRQLFQFAAAIMRNLDPSALADSLRISSQPPQR